LARTEREAWLHELLEDLHHRWHRPEYLATDPLQLAHRYAERADQEVVALLAAAFASGNIKSIIAAVESLLKVMGPHPAAWLADARPGDLQHHLDGFVHRWVQAGDARLLLAQLGGILRRHGTLGGLWREVDDGGATTEAALANFVETILREPAPGLPPRLRVARRADGGSHDLPPIGSVLLTSPRNGSACKRMHLFLRWMVRPADGIDLGLWTSHVAPARLLMPIDTHVLRQARTLRLTTEKQPNRKAMEAITRRMRRLSPADPCRYDFALVRAGIDELRRRPSRQT
jgi:uncharacterized protein (TIGR02757 family)